MSGPKPNQVQPFHYTITVKVQHGCHFYPPTFVAACNRAARWDWGEITLSDGFGMMRAMEDSLQLWEALCNLICFIFTSLIFAYLSILRSFGWHFFSTFSFFYSDWFRHSLSFWCFKLSFCLFCLVLQWHVYFLYLYLQTALELDEYSLLFFFFKLQNCLTRNKTCHG